MGQVCWHMAAGGHCLYPNKMEMFLHVVTTIHNAIPEIITSGIGGSFQPIPKLEKIYEGTPLAV